MCCKVTRNLFVTLFFILSVIPAFAQEGESPQPKIYLPHTMWDFGYVPKSGTVSHIYQIKNIGDDTLIIVKVRTTCGCTTAPLSKERLAPGETAEMEVVFDPRKIKVGESNKRLHVISNDPVNPFTDVRFTAKIGLTNSLVKLTPTEINFDTISSETEEMRTITLENVSGEEVSLSVIEGPGKDLELYLNTQSLKPGESTQINLKLKKDATRGNLSTSLTLDFECSKIARVSIPIGGVIVSN
jgi:uncharacterized cupredoxin-like copper-binding protein